MRFEGQPLANQCQTKESSPEPMRLDLNVYNFLLEGGYLIYNDSGYFSLDGLIDDNINFFKAKFELTVRKALGLILQTDGERKLSSKKKRLRENLLSSFENLRQFIQLLGSDHLLLLKVYATFFNYRIKLFIREGSNFKSRIFGEKGAENKVRLLFDSVMFYVLTKSPESSLKALRRSQSSPSPVKQRSRDPSHSPCRTIKILCDDLCSKIELKPSIKNSNSIQQSQRQLSLCKRSLKNIRRQRRSENGFDCNPEVSQSFKELNNQSSLLQSRMRKKLSESVSPQPSFHSVNSWTNLFNKLTQETSLMKPCGYAGEASTKQICSERGMLVSYSASRQCGFILTDSELEVLVIQEELLQAGVPENLLARSCKNIGHNVKFNLNLLSSEPIATFEATNLKFTNFFLK